MLQQAALWTGPTGAAAAACVCAGPGGWGWGGWVGGGVCDASRVASRRRQMHQFIINTLKYFLPGGGGL